MSYDPAKYIPARQWRYDLKSRYGITPLEYYRFFAQQNGVCGACGDPPGEKRLAVDHCHATGDIRGLLCAHCNVALGYLKHDPARTLMATQYLVRYQW